MPAKSKSQRKFFGIAKSIKKGETPASYSPAAAKAAKSMTGKEIDKFAKTKEKKLPRKVGGLKKLKWPK